VTLSERIRGDLKTALTAKDLVRANALRMLMAQFKNAEIEKRAPLTSEDCLGQVGRAIKIRREAIEGAVKAGREDLKAKEEAELAALIIYLPAQLSPDELEALAAAAIAEAGAKGPADMGRVMKALMPRITGKADGAAASAAVRRLLSGS
jgi:hypothetical protein